MTHPRLANCCFFLETFPSVAFVGVMVSDQPSSSLFRVSHFSMPQDDCLSRCLDGRKGSFFGSCSVFSSYGAGWLGGCLLFVGLFLRQLADGKLCRWRFVESSRGEPKRVLLGIESWGTQARALVAVPYAHVRSFDHGFPFLIDFKSSICNCQTVKVFLIIRSYITAVRLVGPIVLGAISRFTRAFYGQERVPIKSHYNCRALCTAPYAAPARPLLRAA